MKKYAINTQSNKTFEVASIEETAVVLVLDGKLKAIKPSTFKRYYKLLDNNLKVDDKQTIEIVEQQREQIQKNQEAFKRDEQNAQKKHNVDKAWKAYYRPYQQNEDPLWNAVIKENKLIIYSVNQKPVMTCQMSSSGRCIKVKQLNDNCKRYFAKFSVARKHILHNQDIRTTKAIGIVFDKWLADQKLFFGEV